MKLIISYLAKIIPLAVKFLLTYAITLFQYLSNFHSGDMIMKIKASTKISVLTSLFFVAIDYAAMWLNTMTQLSVWIIDNAVYIKLVLFAIGIDHFLGTIKHLFWTKDFHFKKNILGLLIKTGLVVCCGVLFEGLNTLIHEDNLIKSYLTTTTRIIVFLYPAGSAFSSSSVISGGKFPPIGWINKLRKFQQNLDTKEFQKPNNDNVEPQNHNEP